jgi:hypothetical protein
MPIPRRAGGEPTCNRRAGRRPALDQAVGWLLQATVSSARTQVLKRSTPSPMTEPATEPPSLRWRLTAAVIAGVVAAMFVIVLYARQTANVVSDWDAIWVGAGAYLRGESPYAAVQMPPWPWRINYPFPAILLSTPFALLPLPFARGAFVGIVTAVFTFAITRRARWSLYFLISGAMLWSWIAVKWEPVLIAAALTPALGWLLVVKPTMGFALWAAYPRRSAVIGGLVLLGLSFVLHPPWLSEWFNSFAGTPHRPHLVRPGGFLLLLSLLRWKRSEGRLLAALCIIPQTTALYEVLPLALLAENRRHGAVFAGVTMAAHLVYQLGPQGPWPVGAEYQWWVMLGMIYLPGLVIILRRPNQSRADHWAAFGWPRFVASEPGTAPSAG